MSDKPSDKELDEVVAAIMGPSHDSMPADLRKQRYYQLRTIVRAAWPHVLRVSGNVTS